MKSNKGKIHLQPSGYVFPKVLCAETMGRTLTKQPNIFLTGQGPHSHCDSCWDFVQNQGWWTQPFPILLPLRMACEGRGGREARIGKENFGWKKKGGGERKQKRGFVNFFSAQHPCLTCPSWGCCMLISFSSCLSCHPNSSYWDEIGQPMSHKTSL